MSPNAGVDRRPYFPNHRREDADYLGHKRQPLLRRMMEQLAKHRDSFSQLKPLLD